jgi:cytochrome c-type biogenesis protein CcmF
MLNNWILLFCAFFVLFATMFPTLSEAVRGAEGRITVGAAFFNKWMTPIGLILLVLTGVGPLLAWRKTTPSSLREQFVWPTIAGLAMGGAAVALGVRVWSSGLCFAFGGFVVGTIAQEFWRGARVRQQTTGTDLFTALVGLVGRNKRRYGGYVVHAGIVLMFLGFAGEGFKQTDTVLLTPGKQVTVRDYTLRLDSLRESKDDRKQAITGYLTVLRGGEELTKMYPARWFFHTNQSEPTTEVAIRRSFAEDLYVVMPAFELASQEAHLEVTVTPLVNWVWLGFGVIALGTLIALLPETVFAFAMARVPETARVTGAWLLPLLLVGSVGVQAQDGVQPVTSSTGQVTGKNALYRQVEGEVICMCGSSGCVRASLANCPMRPACHGHSEQIARLRQLVDEGKTHDEILAAFVSEYGQHVLSVPEDRGFNRLAWMLPYVLAAAGLIVIIVNARRWSRRPALATAGPSISNDPALEARLDDELRDLD